MGYKVHRLEINMEEDAANLETFLNGLAGEVVAIIPNIKKTTLAPNLRSNPQDRLPTHRRAHIGFTALRDEAWLAASYSCGGLSMPFDAESAE